MPTINKSQLQNRMRFFLSGNYQNSFTSEHEVFDAEKPWIYCRGDESKADLLINKQGQFVSLDNYDDDFNIKPGCGHVPKITAIHNAPGRLQFALHHGHYGNLVYKPTIVRKKTMLEVNEIIFRSEGYHVEIVE